MPDRRAPNIEPDAAIFAEEPTDIAWTAPSGIIDHDHDCPCCSGGNYNGDSDASGATGTSASAQTADLPSFTVDEAAAHLSRRGLTWSDGGGGVAGFSYGAAVAEGATVTYGFLGTNSLSADGGSTPTALNAAEIAAVEYAMTVIADVADVTFVRVTGAGGVYLGDADEAQIDIQGWADTNAGLWSGAYRGDHFTEATVSIGERGLEEIGSYAFRTALHEIAHALGLSHPGDYDGGRPNYAADAEYAEDSAQFTVMSYFREAETGADFGGVRATGLMLHDIAALQRLYGANGDTRGGDTVYGFGSNTGDDGWLFEHGNDTAAGAIWDAGGRDRLDASGYDDDQVIDLGEGAFSSLGGLDHNVSIAVGAVIEDAVGGSGADRLIGNAVGNVLAGGTGDDAIFGGAGDDVIFGGVVPDDWAI